MEMKPTRGRVLELVRNRRDVRSKRGGGEVMAMAKAKARNTDQSDKRTETRRKLGPSDE
jgi:hypothetical protein